MVALPSTKGDAPIPASLDMPERIARALAAYEETLRSVLLSTGDPDARPQRKLEAGLAAARRAFEDCLMQP
jgi:hypothetical protein